MYVCVCVCMNEISYLMTDYGLISSLENLAILNI